MSDHSKEREIPYALIGIGVALYALSAFIHAGKAGVVTTLIFVGIGGSLQTVILIGAAFLVASVLSVSFGDMRSAVLKFAGITLASGGLGSVIPMGGIIGSVIFLGLVIWLFEIDLPYAIALAVANFLISVVVLLLLRSALA